MKAERGYGSSHFFSEKYLDGFLSPPSSNGNGYAAAATISTSSSSNSSPSSPGIGSCIEHRVSKTDTLAGIAIKYGVEVPGIRRMNGLVTDLQMFALKSLQIPLPGTHPPSPASAANGEQTHPPRHHDDLLDSLQSLQLKPTCKVSPAMSTLHGYYGLPTPKTGPTSEGTEMAVYKTARVLSLEDGLLPRESPASDSGFSQPRKSRSLVFLENGDLSNEIAESGDGNEADKSIRSCQNVEVDTSVRTPEILLKEDNGGGITGRTGNGLALRPKLGSRTDMDASWQNAAPITTDSFIGDLPVSVQKSSSTYNLQDTETTSSSIWPTGKWSDAIARPIFDGFPMFDGLPKPMTGRRTKAALD
ncbi:uncharacterized protein M6B38_280930 [Iris pallida]|uniref:LysM domain-containing protein n=1 Tax=Iris pallida TaxID=29817 RepID=A0AAX6E6Q1_IRIPA|nr:uncharacterized protein M6B38_206505 [Iris pallida]KAJ6846455.1 uncharacterized protein M6B38_280930 [Iris pallida]